MLLLINLLVFLTAGYVLIFVARKSITLIKRYRANKTLSANEIAGFAEDVALISKVAAVVAGIAATFAAPVGLMAFASAIGLIPRPIIVVALPVFIALAGISAAFSAAAKLYAKSKRN